jgi:hypothetical protein
VKAYGIEQSYEEERATDSDLCFDDLAPQTHHDELKKWQILGSEMALELKR